MVKPEKRKERHLVLTFIRKVMCMSDLTQFLDEAPNADIEHVERTLGL